jgi:glycerol-3-phosphate O-acyltransferase
LSAQIENLQSGRENPNVYVVPMTVTYDFVLEASSLVEQYLSDIGKEKFLGTDTDDPFPLLKVARFIWRFFKGQAGLTVRVGQPLDVFGNPVDDAGQSQGPNGTTVDVRRWLTTRGELAANTERDMEYVRECGTKIVGEFFRNNTVSPTQVVPFAYFRALRAKYPEYDLFRLMRLGFEQRSLPLDRLVAECEKLVAEVRDLADAGKVAMGPGMKYGDPKRWVIDGIQSLGTFHDAAVLKLDGDVVYTEDMSLLYYYRNRLSGYGLSHVHDFGGATRRARGVPDEKGFLA